MCLKQKEKILLSLSAILLFLCIGIEIDMHIGKGVEHSRTNRKTELYSAELPPLPRVEADAIDINTATKEELMTLHGIGEVMADKILVYRAENGDFVHPACIMEVSGIGEKTYESLKTKIKIGNQ